jgi:hypothetical protein
VPLPPVEVGVMISPKVPLSLELMDRAAWLALATVTVCAAEEIAS